MRFFACASVVVTVDYFNFILVACITDSYNIERDIVLCTCVCVCDCTSEKVSVWKRI